MSLRCERFIPYASHFLYIVLCTWLYYLMDLSCCIDLTEFNFPKKKERKLFVSTLLIHESKFSEKNQFVLRQFWETKTRNARISFTLLAHNVTCIFAPLIPINGLNSIHISPNKLLSLISHLHKVNGWMHGLDTSKIAMRKW